MNVVEYLTHYAPELADKIEQNFVPMQMRGDTSLPLPKLKREPIGGQADAIRAIAKTMREGQKTVNTIGTMGVGKTMIALAAIHTHAEGQPYRAIVMCPPHLPSKWVREILSTIPAARPRIVERYHELVKLAALRPDPIAPEFYVMSESMAKMGTPWKPAFVRKSVSEVEIVEGKRRVRTSNALACPQCYEPIRRKGDDELLEFMSEPELAKRQHQCEQCGTPLWSWTHQYERWPLATFIHRKMRGVFDYAVLDECFVAETLISTPTGLRPISEMRPGDEVLTWDGATIAVSKVVRKFTNLRKKRLVRVTYSGGFLVCTSDHKFLANGRWVPACELKPGDRLVTDNEKTRGLSAREELRGVREIVPSDREEKEEQVLLAGVSIEGTQEAFGAVCRLRSTEAAPQRQVLLQGVCGQESVDGGIESQSERSSAEYGSFRAGPKEVASQHAETEWRSSRAREIVGQQERQALRRSPWWQWEAPASLSSIVGERIRVADRSVDTDGQSKVESGADRHCRHATESGNRDRRFEPYYANPEGSRPAEGCDAWRHGVVDCSATEVACRVGSQEGDRDCECGKRVEVLSVEPCDRADQYVYDLEVADTHCYFAGGVLVHNCHQAAADSSAIAIAMSKLVQSVRHVIPLTGTYLNGYAHSIMHLLWRTSPETLQTLGFGYGETTSFAQRYGRLQKTIKYKDKGEANRESRGSVGRTTVKVLPGVMPTLFGDHLLNKSVFISLEDISDCLPKLESTVSGVEMDYEQAAAYAELELRMPMAIELAMQQKNMSLLTQLVQALMGYTDFPHQYGELGYQGDFGWETVARPRDLDPDVIRPKEQELIDGLVAEAAEGRQSWVFVEMTQKRDVQARLQKLIKQAGLRVKVLRSGSVPTKAREEWIAANAPGCDVVVSHPALVETGLDLFDKGGAYNFPTLIFYQTGLHLSTLRQASRRSWRIGQPLDCKVKYLFYKGTMQQRFVDLMAAKLQAAEAIDGKFSTDGLAALSDAGESMGVALAKSLLESIKQRRRGGLALAV